MQSSMLSFEFDLLTIAEYRPILSRVSELQGSVGIIFRKTGAKRDYMDYLTFFLLFLFLRNGIQREIEPQTLNVARLKY